MCEAPSPSDVSENQDTVISSNLGLHDATFVNRGQNINQ